MKLTNKDGKVAYLMVAGKDMVSAEMPVEIAQRIISRGDKQTSDRFPGYPLCVDGKYYFSATPERKKPKKQREAANE